MHKAGIDVEDKVDFCITGEETVQELTEGPKLHDESIICPLS